MSKDILERAKALRSSAFGTHKQALDVVDELIAEVEANQIMLRQLQVHEDQTHAAMEKIVGNSDNFVELTRQMKAEVERLRSAPKSGLYGKYIIQKADGSTVDPKADYFILRLDTDPYARIAALEYAIQTDDQNLGKQLEARVFDHVFSPDDQCRARADAWPLGMIKRMEAEVAVKDARIKELEAEITAWVADRDSWIGRYEAVRKEKDARIADQEAYIERLEAAFLREKTACIAILSQYTNREMIIHNSAKSLSECEKEAREALEEAEHGTKNRR